MDNTSEGPPKPVDSELSQQVVMDYVRQSEEIVRLIETYPVEHPGATILEEHTQISIAKDLGGGIKTAGTGLKRPLIH